MKTAILPWSKLKKVFSILKSSLSPDQIAFSFALGVFAGVTPMGLHVIIPMTLALLVRGSFRAFLLSMGLFKLISIGLAPVSYSIGRFLLDTTRGLDSMWRVLTHLPVAAPMGYNRYLLLGALTISLAIAIPVFLAVRFIVLKYRHGFAAWVSGWNLSANLRGKKWAGVLRWLFVGGKPKYESTKAPRGVFRYIRRDALVILPLVYVVCYLLAALIVPFFSGTIAISAASYVIGGEVAVKDSSFNLFTGRLNLTGLSVQDPNEPQENILEVPSFTLDAGMIPLLEKRVVFNAIALDDAYMHVTRQEDGTLNVDDFNSGWNFEGYVEWAAKHADDVDWWSLLQRLIDYMGQPRPRKPKADLSQYAGGRSFAPYKPVFAVEELAIGQIHVSLEDRRNIDQGFPPLLLTDVNVENLVIPAKLGSKPIIITLEGFVGQTNPQNVDDLQAAFVLAVSLDDRGELPVHKYTLEVSDMELTKMSWLYNTSLPVKVLSGRATVSASVTITGEQAAGEASLALKDLIIAQPPGENLFGLSQELTQRSIEGINRYAKDLPIVIGVAIDGSADSPEVHWQEPLLEIARQGLMLEGKRELQGAIDQLGTKLGTFDRVPDVKLPPGYQQLQEQAEDYLRQAMVGGDGEQDSNGATELMKDILDQLFPHDTKD